MPTGYTVYIEDGDITTGKQFLLLCSRAFGIAVDIRDEPLSVPTPTRFEPNKYYKDAYIRTANELNRLRNISIDAARQNMRNEYYKRVKHAKAQIKRMEEINQRYQKVKDQILKWDPPTEGHARIKEFAIDQINMCINPKESFEYYKNLIDTPFDDSDEAVRSHIFEMIELLMKDMTRYKKYYDEEVISASNKTRFMKEFIDSLEEIEE